VTNSSSTTDMFAVQFFVECRYRKTSLSLPRCYRITFTVPMVLPWYPPSPRGNYHGYRVITVFPVTVSSSSAYENKLFIF